MTRKNRLSLRGKFFVTASIVLVAAAGVFFTRGRDIAAPLNEPAVRGAQAGGSSTPESGLLNHSAVLNEIKTWAVLQDVSVELHSSSGKPAVSNIQLRSQLDEQLVEAALGKRAYRYRLTQVDFQSTNAEGKSAMAPQDIEEIERSLAAAVILVRTDDSRRELRFSAARGTALETLNLIRSVILSGSLFLPRQQQLVEWISQESDATGVFSLSNKLMSLKDGVAQIEKEPKAVQVHANARTLNAEGDALAVLPGSITRLTFDAQAGHVLKSEQRWTLRFQAAGVYATTNILTRLEFVGKRTATQSAAEAETTIEQATDQDFITEVELEALSEEGLKRKVAAQKSAGETWESLRLRLQSSDFHKDGAARFQFLEQLSALMYLQPEICVAVAEEMARLKKDDPNYASKLSLLAGAFSNQETPEAEAAIVALSQRVGGDADALMQIIPAMAAHRRPGEKTRDALLQQYENGISDEVKSTSTLALGTFAQRAQKNRPDLNQEAVSRLARDFDAAPSTSRKVTLAGALGNAGAQETFTSVKSLINSTQEPALQRSAVYDLRFVRDPAVDVWLQKLSTERGRDGDLVIQALRVMRARPPVRGNFEAATAIARIADARTTVRVEALHTIAHHVILSPEEVSATLTEFSRDSNPQIVQQARQLLAKLPKPAQ
ncbi:MAG: hypothetical protein RI932_1579 [Pseudomonadota bacterium]